MPPGGTTRLVIALLLAVPALCDRASAQHRGLAGSSHVHNGVQLQTFSAGLPHLSPSDLRAVAVVNPYPFCHDIVFGIYYAMSLLTPHVDVYYDQSKHGMDKLGAFHTVGVKEVVQSILDRPILAVQDLANNSHTYDLVIYADWYGPEGPTDKDTSLQAMLAAGYKGKIWIFNHEPDYLFWPFLTDTARTKELKATPAFMKETWEVYNLPQLEWFTIAPHVRNTLQVKFGQMGLNKTVHWVCPVFPAVQPGGRWQPASAAGKMGFAVQGAHSRRNYTALFTQLAARQDILDKPLFQIQTYTWGPLQANTIPETVRPHVTGKNHLDFEPFYGNMSQNLAMLTLFDTKRYFHDAASSSVVVTINTGTPLIVEPGFLEVYTFVSAGSVVVAENRDYAGAIEKILNMSAAQWEELAMEMVVTRQANVVRNLQVFARLLRHRPQLVQAAQGTTAQLA
ncbi:hypothetical protein WJX73_005028 [Symbiochloris irregularis]|uniref:Glycosyltransferase family 1 protein n=1 Tax=Symbiochloris irregularis TaxID=706552 RepID=A0AAW1NYJ8_9CHLO